MYIILYCVKAHTPIRCCDETFNTREAAYRRQRQLTNSGVVMRIPMNAAWVIYVEDPRKD